MQTRYKVVKKEEKKKSDSILNLDLYVADEELSSFYVVHTTKGLVSGKYIDGKIDDYTANMFDLSMALVSYDIKFYDALLDSLITSKLNNMVLRKNPNFEVRRPIYETLAKEELAYTSEEDRAYKELIKENK